MANSICETNPSQFSILSLIDPVQAQSKKDSAWPNMSLREAEIKWRYIVREGLAQLGLDLSFQIRVNLSSVIFTYLLTVFFSSTLFNPFFCYFAPSYDLHESCQSPHYITYPISFRILIKLVP